jgi:UDP-N-acetylmuramoylalanine-D-glutamate ligase
MFNFENKDVLVIGLGGRGQAACELLRKQGANVAGVDIADTADLREGAKKLQLLGVDVALGVSTPPERDFSLAVLSPTVPADAELIQAIMRSDLPMIV